MNEIVLDANIKRPSRESLRRFTSFESLPDDKLKQIAQHAELRQAKKHAVLMNIGEDNKQSIFLLKGNVLLEAADNRQRIIKHTDPSARMPLSRLRPSHYKVTTLTPISYICIDNRLLDELINQEMLSEIYSSHYVVEESSEENTPLSTQIVAHIYEDLQHNQLLLNSWHPVALGVSRQIINERSDTQKIAEIAALDPVLSLKLLKAQSLADQKTSGKSASLLQAVNTISLHTSHRLTFMNLFQESARPRGTLLSTLFRQTWERAIMVSSVAREIAKVLGHQDPNVAALAGALHNIGDATILSYAYRHYRKATPQDFSDCITNFSADINRILLSHWNVLHNIIQATADSRDLMHDSGKSTLSLTNILIAAQAIVRTTLKDGPPQPPLPQIPAIRKLDLTTRGSGLIRDLQKIAEKAAPHAYQKLGIASPLNNA